MQSPRTSNHELYMRRCFDLARKGRPAVRLNPLVGAVIVYQDRIIGEGYHKTYGGHHGEIEALLSVRDEDKKYLTESTLYVNLAPCDHEGKTPPCSMAIIEAGIPTVVVGITDKNHLADGGIKRLKAAGVHVVVDVLGREASELNQAFLQSLDQLRPYVTLKWAESYDGFIGSADRQVPISNSLSNLKVHELRSLNNAILVGSHTIAIDNPQLTTREVPGAHPLRVVIVGSGILPLDSVILTDEFPLLLVAPHGYTYSLREPKQVIYYEDDRVDLEELINILHIKYNVGYLMVEGGANILQQFIDGDLWDEIWRIKSMARLDSGVPAPKLNESPSKKLNFEDDQIEIFRRW